MLRIYILGRDELKNIKWDKGFFSERRQKTLVRTKKEEARGLSVCAELALIYAAHRYSKETGLLFKLPFEIAQETEGKPYFAEGSPFFGRLHFSLSHSGSYAVAAVSDIPVGVDIEYVSENRIRRPEKILYFNEYNTFVKINDPTEKNAYFYECWVAKESLLKEAGIGIRVRPSEFSISENGYAASSEFAAAHPGLSEKQVHIFRPEELPLPEYRLAVCSASLPDAIPVSILDAGSFSGLRIW